MHYKSTFAFKPVLLAVAAALALSACGDSRDVVATDTGDDHSHDHDHDHDHHLHGRLAITEANDDHLYIFDMEDEAIIAEFHLPDAGARIYPSPGYRYAVAINRDIPGQGGVVSFIDSGYETEAHGDHYHLNTHSPEMLDFALHGELPTHYDYYLTRGAVFFDGVSGVPAMVNVISDHSLSESRLIGEVNLETNMHGAAEVRNNHLFVTYRSTATDSVLPDFVELYHRHDGEYEWVTRFETECPGLHGSAINDHFVAFGCRDGVLLIEGHDHSFEDSKINNPEFLADARIGTLYAHKGYETFIGRADQRLVLIDPDHAEMDEIHWRDEDSDRRIAGAGFNHSGNRFAVLDDHGHLTIVRLRDHGYEIQSEMHIFDEIDSDALPTIAFSAVSHDAFAVNPATREVVAIDLHDGEVEERFSLDFAPAGVVWLGFLEEEDDHHH